MLYLFIAFIAGVVTLAAAQLLHAQLRRHRARRALLVESELVTKLQAQGWVKPSSSHPDWLSDRWPSVSR